MNLIFSSWHAWLLSCLIMAAASSLSSSSAAEYEVDGNVNQIIATPHGGKLHATASFKVFVRDCGWFIETVETNEIGGVTRREIGATNGTEIYECRYPLGWIQSPPASTNGTSSEAPVFKESSGPALAVIVPGPVPIGETDSAIFGHLWLIFASQCYWPTLNSDQLRPVYDWQASVAAHGQDITVSAGWNFLNGSGSLPREVWYLGEWGQTNGLYTITGTNSVRGTPIPTGFVFERFQIGPLTEDSFVHEMVAVKRVDVKVTAIHPRRARTSLIPSPDRGAMVVDRRFDSGIPNRPPSYQNPVTGQWLTVEKSKELATLQQANDLRNLARAKLLLEEKKNGTPDYRPIVLPIMCLSLIGPPIIYLFFHKRQKS